MLLREGDSVFAAYGHPNGPAAYYTEVAAERAAAEAAVVHQQREAELAAVARRQAALDGDDPVAWREALLATLDFGGMHAQFKTDLEATELRFAAAETVFYPEHNVEPDPGYGKFVTGPSLFGSEYSRREGVVSRYLGPTVMHVQGRVSAELVLAA